VANAWQDRVPMLFITGCVDAAEAATYTHQVFDHAALLGAVTKASLRVEDGKGGFDEQAFTLTDIKADLVDRPNLAECLLNLHQF